MFFFVEISEDKTAITLEKYANPTDIDRLRKAMLDSDGHLMTDIRTGGQKLLLCSAHVIALALGLEIRSQLGDN